MTTEATPGNVPLNDQLGADDEDALFADFPPLTPGRITYGTLLAIVEWRDRHGIGGDVSKDTVLAYQEEGRRQAERGLSLA